MTSIYAKPAKTQKMPLTVNSANTADGGAGVGGEKDVTSQPVKKFAPTYLKKPRAVSPTRM